MEMYARLIHKANTNFLPTNLPAQFYGMPDGKVVIIYARFYDVSIEETGLEFVFAEHEEFQYDYEKGQIISNGGFFKAPIYSEMIDKPNPKFSIVEVRRSLDSFSKAFERINQKALDILTNLKLTQPESIV